jgi:hypothetical protein
MTIYNPQSQYSSVDVAKGYGLDDRVSNPGKGKKLFYTSQSQNRLWDLSNFLSNAYGEILPRG